MTPNYNIIDNEIEYFKYLSNLKFVFHYNNKKKNDNNLHIFNLNIDEIYKNLLNIKDLNNGFAAFFNFLNNADTALKIYYGQKLIIEPLTYFLELIDLTLFKSEILINFIDKSPYISELFIKLLLPKFILHDKNFLNNDNNLISIFNTKNYNIILHIINNYTNANNCDQIINLFNSLDSVKYYYTNNGTINQDYLVCNIQSFDGLYNVYNKFYSITNKYEYFLNYILLNLSHLKYNSELPIEIKKIIFTNYLNNNFIQNYNILINNFEYKLVINILFSKMNEYNLKNYNILQFFLENKLDIPDECILLLLKLNTVKYNLKNKEIIYENCDHYMNYNIIFDFFDQYNYIFNFKIFEILINKLDKTNNLYYIKNFIEKNNFFFNIKNISLIDKFIKNHIIIYNDIYFERLFSYYNIEHIYNIINEPIFINNNYYKFNYLHIEKLFENNKINIDNLHKYTIYKLLINKILFSNNNITSNLYKTINLLKKFKNTHLSNNYEFNNKFELFYSLITDNINNFLESNIYNYNNFYSDLVKIFKTSNKINYYHNVFLDILINELEKSFYYSYSNNNSSIFLNNIEINYDINKIYNTDLTFNTIFGYTSNAINFINFRKILINYLLNLHPKKNIAKLDNELKKYLNNNISEINIVEINKFTQIILDILKDNIIENKTEAIQKIKKVTKVKKIKEVSEVKKIKKVTKVKKIKEVTEVKEDITTKNKK